MMKCSPAKKMAGKQRARLNNQGKFKATSQ